MQKTVGSTQPISWDRHRAWSWHRPENYAFASTLRSVPVTSAEAALAASCFPLVFVQGAQGPTLHALLRRCASGRSAFIGQHGQWQAAWLPPRLACWPFELAEVNGYHALALNESNHSVIRGPGGAPIFEDGETAALSPETARMAAILKVQAEALPATMRASAALQDHALLTQLDGDGLFLTVGPVAAANLAEEAVLYLHQEGALALLHAALVSLAHLPWMERAEEHLATAPTAESQILPSHKRACVPSSYIGALAMETSEDAALIQFLGNSQS